MGVLLTKDSYINLQKYMNNSIFIKIKDGYNDFLYRESKKAINKENFTLAYFIDILRLENTILGARKKANFNLKVHMESLKNDVYPLKPICNCDFCKHVYLSRLKKDALLSITRNIDLVLRERNRLEKEELRTEIRNKDRRWSFNSYIRNIPIRNVNNPFLYAQKQKVVANRLRKEIRQHNGIAKKLAYILNIPNNE